MGLWKNLMTKNWYKRKEPIKPLPKIDLEWSPGFIIKDELSEIPVAIRKEEHDRLHIKTNGLKLIQMHLKLKNGRSLKI